MHSLDARGSQRYHLELIRYGLVHLHRLMHSLGDCGSNRYRLELTRYGLVHLHRLMHSLGERDSHRLALIHYEIQYDLVKMNPDSENGFHFGHQYLM